MADVILQRIVIEGGKAIEAALRAIGDAGDRAFKRLQGAGQAAGAGFDRLETASNAVAAAAKRAGISIEEMQARIARASATINTGLAPAVASFAARVAALGGTVRGALGSAFTNASQAAAGLTASFSGLDRTAIRFGRTVTQLGRAAQIPGIRLLGRDISLLGRAFLVAAPAIIAFGLEKLASSAAHAIEGIQTLADTSRLTITQFQNISSAAVGAGVSTDDFAKAMDKLRKTVDTTDQRFTDVSQRIRDLRKENQDLLASVTSAPTDSEKFSQNFAKITDSVTKNNREIAKLQVQIDGVGQDFFQLSDAEQRAAKQADEGRTVLQKLGIDVRNTAKELKPLDQILVEIADKFSKLPAGAQRTRVEFDLTAEFGRKLTDQLALGAVAFQNLQEQGKKLTPPFTTEEVATATRFTTSLTQASEASANLKNKIGILFAPALTAAFNTFNESLIRNRDSIVAFGQSIADAVTPFVAGLTKALTGADLSQFELKPEDVIKADKWADTFNKIGTVLQGFGTAIVTVSGIAVKAFEVILDVLDKLASGINAVFGTNLTGTEILVAAWVAKLVGLFGLLTGAARLLFGAFGFVIRGLVLVGTALATIVGAPIAAAIVALAALAAAFLFFAPQSVKDKVANFFTGLKDQVLNALGFTQDANKKIGESFEKAADAGGKAFSEASTEITGSFDKIASEGKKVGDAGSTISSGLAPASDALKKIVTAGKESTVVTGQVAEGFTRLVTAGKQVDIATGQVAEGFTRVIRGGRQVDEAVRPVAEGFTRIISGGQQFDVASGRINDALDSQKAGLQGIIGPLQQVKSGYDETGAAILTETEKQLVAQGKLLDFSKVAKDAGKNVLDFSKVAADASRNLIDLSGAGKEAATAMESVQAASSQANLAEPVQQATASLQEFASTFVTLGADNPLSPISAEFEKFQTLMDSTVTGVMSISDAFDQLGNTSPIQKATDAVKRLDSTVEDAIRDFGQMAVAESSAGGFARGGAVWGRGTSTSDSIPAYLSTGEFVHNAKAVRHYGHAFMQALNQMRVPKDVLGGFRLGGLVDGLKLNLPLKLAGGGAVPAFAGGGAMHPVTIDLGGGHTVSGLRASGNVVKELQRAAVSRQIASAGRKPTYYGRGK